MTILVSRTLRFSLKMIEPPSTSSPAQRAARSKPTHSSATRPSGRRSARRTTGTRGSWRTTTRTSTWNRAPVHIVTGSAGSQEGRDRFYHNPYKWSAFRSQDYGYTRFVAHNHSHIYMEQISVDLQGKVIDSFWLVKDTH